MQDFNKIINARLIQVDNNRVVSKVGLIELFICCNFYVAWAHASIKMKSHDYKLQVRA